MTEQKLQIDPMSGFIISENARLTNYDQEIINALYQPILGPEATILLTTLWNLLVDQPMLSQRILHIDLINIVNLAPQTILAAREKLEALNLLRTWHNNDTLGEYYIYELHAPLLPQNFFTDELMSVLLLTAVGPKYYQTLQQKFQLRQLVNIDGTDISKKITDVFTINSEAFKIVNTLEKLPTQRFESAQPVIEDIVVQAQQEFDMGLLFDSISNTGITKATLNQNRNLFYTLHQMFGIDELTLDQVIRQTMTFDTHEIDTNQLKQKVIELYAQKNYQTDVAVNTKSADLAANPPTKVPKNKVLAKFLADTRELKPLEFLESVKVQNNGYVTPNEIKTITDVVGKNVLTIEVINSLIFYILTTLGRENINRAYFNSIANTLSQNRVTDAYEALKFLANYQRKKEKDKKQSSSFNGNKAYRKVETKPTYQQQTSKVSTKDLNATKARLAKLKENRANQ